MDSFDDEVDARAKFDELMAKRAAYLAIIDPDTAHAAREAGAASVRAARQSLASKPKSDDLESEQIDDVMRRPRNRRRRPRVLIVITVLAVATTAVALVTLYFIVLKPNTGL